jgi:hypothetical protein
MTFDRVARLLFVLGLAALLALTGIVIGWYRWPPAPQIDASVAAFRDWRTHWKSYLGSEPTKYLRPARYPGEGVVIFEPELAQPGVTLMTGLWDGRLPGLSLRALDGRELHRWPVAVTELWSDASHLRPDEVPFNDIDAHIHGAVLYPNGDVVFNITGVGTTRLDRCGQVVWRLPHRTHHSITIDEQGDLWIPGKKAQHAVASDRFPRLTPPFDEDSVLKVSPETGEILREISALDVLYGSGYEGALFPNAERFVHLDTRDPLHLNHVEALPTAMAAAFPMFEAGDLLISMREINLVMVVDPETEKIRWAKTGPWVRQHEPHFMPDGRISVFDNRQVDNAQHAARGKPRLASRILAIDPKTGAIEVLHEGTLEQPFYTDIMGKQQALANGNLLVTEPTAGRAFEVTPDGRIVWSFINRFDEKRVAMIEQATRYPESYAEFASEGCPVS